MPVSLASQQSYWAAAHCLTRGRVNGETRGQKLRSPLPRAPQSFVFCPRVSPSLPSFAPTYTFTSHTHAPTLAPFTSHTHAPTLAPFTLPLVRQWAVFLMRCGCASCVHMQAKEIAGLLRASDEVVIKFLSLHALAGL